MLIYILYIILLIIVIYITFLGYIRFKHQFWSRQPVFHFHDIYYWIFPQNVIYKKITDINYKYYNQTIVKKTFEDFTKVDITQMVDFLKKNYLRTKECKYLPNDINFTPYFQGHNQNSYFHIFYDKISKYESSLFLYFEKVIPLKSFIVRISFISDSFIYILNIDKKNNNNTYIKIYEFYKID